MRDISFSGDQLFWIIIIAITGLVIGWCVTFIVLHKKDEQIKALLLDGNVVKMLTIIFIVVGTAVLAVLNSMTDAVSAIYAGIIGYVLGSMQKTA